MGIKKPSYDAVIGGLIFWQCFGLNRIDPYPHLSLSRIQESFHNHYHHRLSHPWPEYMYRQPWKPFALHRGPVGPYAKTSQRRQSILTLRNLIGRKAALLISHWGTASAVHSFWPTAHLFLSIFDNLLDLPKLFPSLFWACLPPSLPPFPLPAPFQSLELVFLGFQFRISFRMFLFLFLGERSIQSISIFFSNDICYRMTFEWHC